MSGERYLTAREAAANLGVSVRTLYAYVSRGLIRSEAVGGRGRDRRYRAEDVRALRERKERRRDPRRAAQGALEWGVPVMESGITLISGGRFYYRGRDATALAGDHSLERVAELIWTKTMTPGDLGRLPELFRASREIGAQTGFSLGGGAPWTFSPTETFGVALQRAAVEDPAAYDLRPAAVARTGVRILRLLVAASTGRESDDTVAGALQRHWVPRDAGAACLIDRALVLCADHELNVSSFTARCVASAGATPYAVVVGGLAALGGVKHGGNIERVEAFLAEARAAGDPEGVAAVRLRRGETVPGFGHRLYPEGDPRGADLLAALKASYPDSGALRFGEDVADAAGALMDERPNLDFALTVLAGVLGFPAGGALALFALGRTVGWVGHAIEQYEMGTLIRPRARYVGEQPAGA